MLLSFAWNLLIFVLTPLFMRFYALEPDTKQLVIWLVLIHNLFNAIAYPFSGALSNGLRAAGDVKFSMITSCCTMWLCRVALCVYLCRIWGFGPIAVWIGMFADWSIRAVIFSTRFHSRKWLNHHILG